LIDLSYHKSGKKASREGGLHFCLKYGRIDIELFVMENIGEKLGIIKEAILRSVPAKKIYLFGSYAYGKPKEESDIDIYGVIPDDFEKGITTAMGEIANYLYHCDILNVDLFLVKEKKFLNYLDYSSFEGTIVKKGKVLYEH
jgi:predicted nucleotidyltransferase